MQGCVCCGRWRPTLSPEPIQVTHVNEKYMVWSIEGQSKQLVWISQPKKNKITLQLTCAAAMLLRQRFHVTGSLVGSHVAHPQQNESLTLPLLLTQEETALLLAIGGMF